MIRTIKNIYGFMKKDFKETYKSIFFFVLIALWVLISVAMSIQVFLSEKTITNYNLTVYYYLKNILLLSIIFYFIPAIIIPMDFENKMVYILRNLRVKFSYFFISKFLSIIIIYLLLILISILSFIITFTFFHYNNLSKISELIIPLLKSYLPLLFILMPVTSLIILLSYVLLTRGDTAIVGAFLFITTLYFVGPFSTGYSSTNRIGYTGYYTAPYSMYAAFLITPRIISGFVAEALGLPDERVIIGHSPTGGTSTLVLPPYFTSFLHFYGYIEFIFIISIVFLLIAYAIGKWRFNNE